MKRGRKRTSNVDYKNTSIYFKSIEVYDALYEELNKQDLSLSQGLNFIYEPLLMILEDLNKRDDKLRRYRIKIILEKVL